MQKADVGLAPYFARQSDTAINRNRVAVIADADATAEEHLYLSPAADRKLTGVLKKEGALLREKQVEAIEVHLLIIDLDLREVGVVRQVECKARSNGILDVETDIAVRFDIKYSVTPSLTLDLTYNTEFAAG